MPRIPRSEILDRLNDKVRRGEAIVGGGAGTGLSAKCEEAGGIDLIVIYNSGRYRMAGRGSLTGLLANGNANQLVLEMADEVLPVVRNTPVLAGVNGTDPFYQPEQFLQEVADRGFSGVQNFPTIGLIDGNFRQNLEETGIRYDLEVELIRAAHELDLFTSPYVFSADDAVAMTDAGADVIVCHFGVTGGGVIGADTTISIDDCARLATEWAAAARARREDVLVLVHGGPLAEPADVERAFATTIGVNGFYGASSMERLPVERAIVEQTRKFVALKPGAR